MKGRRIDWWPDELAWIPETVSWYPTRRAQWQAFQRRFGRGDISLAAFGSLCKRKGWATGRDGRFRKGQVPHNKGKPMPYHPNSARTRFQPGGRSGRAAELWKPIGTERVSKGGYRERKVNDDLPLQSRWRAVHLIRWEALHGPLPPGHALKCLDGERLNTDPANWRAVPRGMLPRLNGKSGRGYDSAPAELKPIIMATAQLAHAAHEARQRRKETNDD